MRDEKSIEEVCNEAKVRAEEDSLWPGMSYEQGVKDALEWVLEQTEYNPLDGE